MSNHPLADRIQRRLGHRHCVAVSQLEVRGEPCRSGQHTAHRVSVEFGDQIDQARAFGGRRRAGGRSFFDLATDDIVGGDSASRS